MLVHIYYFFCGLLCFILFFYHNVVAQGDTKVSAHLNKVKIDTATNIFKSV
jgi:hypothetical protein